MLTHVPRRSLRVADLVLVRRFHPLAVGGFHSSSIRMTILIPSFHLTSIRFRARADFDSSFIRIQTPIAERRFAGFHSFVTRLRDAFWLHLSFMRLVPSSFLLPVARTSSPKRRLFRLSPTHVTLPPNQAMQACG